MTKTRLEAFSDGVIAILITIMVLELKVPEANVDTSLHMLIERWRIFFAYVLSFVFVGIYWANHHHLCHTVNRVTGGILWANLHLLFWLSLVPFTTHWLGASPEFAPAPTAIYGAVMVACAVAWTILQALIIRAHGEDSTLKQAVGSDWKGKASLLAYLIGIAVALESPKLSLAIYATVAAMWFIPDRRIEAQLHGGAR